MISVLHDQASDNVVDGGFGLGLALICAASLLGGPAKDDDTENRGGSHAK